MSASPDRMLHALSFDIEDWFHMIEIKAVQDPATWAALPSIVEARTDQILGILREHRTRATFFVLGWVADRHPELVRRIVDDGHEIGCHTYWHRLIYQQDAAAFRADIAQSVAVLERVTGTRPRGFRAPSFSITQGSEWALDVLVDLGFSYDTSLFPGPRGHGGYEAVTGPQILTTPRGRRIAELPISVARFGPQRLCYAGGGYLRLWPVWMIRHGIEQEARAGKPTVAYLHPRDLAPDCPRVPMSPYRRWKCYVGLAATETKLRTLLENYRWGACEDVLRESIGFETRVAVPA